MADDETILTAVRFTDSSIKTIKTNTFQRFQACKVLKFSILITCLVSVVAVVTCMTRIKLNGRTGQQQKFSRS